MDEPGVKPSTRQTPRMLDAYPDRSPQPSDIADERILVRLAVWLADISVETSGAGRGSHGPGSDGEAAHNLVGISAANNRRSRPA